MNNNHKIIVINKYNKYLVSKFLNIIGDSQYSFRYFKNRDLNAINDHKITCLVKMGKDYVGYAHLDYDEETNDIWLGIAIAENYRNLGLGKELIRFLIDYAKAAQIKFIKLAVDFDNAVAIMLYEKFGFKLIDINTEKKYNIYGLRVSE